MYFAHYMKPYIIYKTIHILYAIFFIFKIYQ